MLGKTYAGGCFQNGPPAGKERDDSFDFIKTVGSVKADDVEIARWCLSRTQSGAVIMVSRAAKMRLVPKSAGFRIPRT